MKVDKNVKKTISDWLNFFKETYFGGASYEYVFGVEDKVPVNVPVVLMGKFAKWEEVKETARAAYAENPSIIIIPPDDVSIIEARAFLKELCRETPTYVSSDGLILAPALCKGYTLSLTLPIYNEADTLAEVIESFLPVVDEVVVGIDEKTDDLSKEIALKYTNQVFWYKWEKSFSKARNACMKNCTSEWIFMTEGHESLLDSSYPVFHYLNKLPPTVGLINVKRIVAAARYQFSMFPWMTRNIPQIKYIYDSHNAVISESKTVCEQVNFPQIQTLHIRGDDKEKFRTEQRRSMNRINLLKDLQKDPKDTRALFYLANEYFSYKEFTKAIEFYTRHIALSNYSDERYQAKLHCGRCLMVLKKEKEAVEMFQSCFLEPVARNDHMVHLR